MSGPPLTPRAARRDIALTVTVLQPDGFSF